MAVAFGSAGTFLTYGSHTNSTLVAPASIANGDFLIAYVFTFAFGGPSPTVTPPAGWTALPGSPITVADSASNGGKNYVFYKVASGESGNYTFTHSIGSSCGIVVCYTGVDTSTPLSPTPTTNSGGGPTCTATGFTTTVADTFIIFAESDWADTATDTVVPTGTTPTFTERLDTVLLYIADGTLASAGATGNKSHTCNSVDPANPNTAYLIGLKPATGGGVAPVTFNANPGSYTLTGTSAALGRQIIDVGDAINDGTGDPARAAFTKCNANFTELYSADATFLTTTVAAATYQPLDADLTAIAALTGTDTIYYRSGTSAWTAVTIGTGLTFAAGTLAASGGGGSTTVTTPQGRLTLVTAMPVMTTTQSAKTTIFYTPYNGNQIVLFDGTSMVPTTFTELSVATTDATKSPAAIGASKVNDWFVWSDAGTLRLSHGPDWTNDTTRSAGTALVMVNGILLNNAAITNGPAASRGTYVGTTRSNASSQLDWIFGTAATGGGAAVFGVWNCYNRCSVATIVSDTTDSWNYGTATWRPFDNNVGNRVSYVAGLGDDSVMAVFSSHVANSSAGAAVIGIGLDVTNAPTGQFGYGTGNLSQIGAAHAMLCKNPGVGFHFLQALEYVAGGSNGTFYGDNGQTYIQSGLAASLRM